MSRPPLISTHDVETFGFSQSDIDDLRMVAERAKCEGTSAGFDEGEKLTRLLNAYEDVAGTREQLGAAQVKAAVTLEGIEDDLDTVRDNLRHYVSDVSDIGNEQDENERRSLSRSLEDRLRSLVGDLEKLIASTSKTRKEFEDPDE